VSVTNTMLGGRRCRLTDSPADYFWRRRGRQARRWPATVPTVEQVVDVGNLLSVYHRLRREAGQAPGIDGLRYDELSTSEAAAVLRKVARSVRDGSYRPHPCRQVRIPKKGGDHRVLRLRVIADRVVAAALHEALTPYWETVFTEHSHGFRPGRGVWTLLAALETDMYRSNRYVLVNEDVHRAFDSLRLDLLVQHHQRYIGDQALMRLITTILHGPDEERRTIGIDQGSAYSPTALVLYLHQTLQHPLVQERHHLPEYVYADNLVRLCSDMTEGHQTINQLQQLLHAAGLQMKGENHVPVNLRAGDQTDLLGYTISLHQGVVTYALADDAWQELDESLEESHQTDNPPETAHNAINGWITWCGPAYSERSAPHLTRRILHLLRRYGFGDIITTESIRQTWWTSWQRWQAQLFRARQRQGRTSSP
jgi:RNA-directed DNA polymerase